MRLPRHDAKRTARTRATFIALKGLQAAECRAAEIRALPQKLWRGVTVYALTCRADFGRGPHEQYLPQAVLWALIDLQTYRCPYHR